MRRKLIKQDAFDSITNNSITKSEYELREAEEVLAKALNKDYLKLRCFNESTAMYETLDGTYVHAAYDIKNEKLTLNNIEELVVDEETKKEKMKGTISEMIDALLGDNKAKADSLLQNYLEMFDWKRGKQQIVTKKTAQTQNECCETVIRKEAAKGNDLAEAYFTAKNVLDYAKFVKLGPVLDEAVSKTDENGNITDIKIPSSKARNEGKILSFNWKTLNHKVKVLRDGASALVENQEFCRAIAELRKCNAVSDSEALEETLENIVRQFPNVLYVTESELASMIKEALQLTNSKNYDDQTCVFMAEGILRKAHSSYVEKVNHIVHLSAAPKMEENADAYLYFQNVVEQFFPIIDERFGLERKAFADLYESLKKVYEKASRRGDNALKNEAASYLNELADVLNNNLRPDLELAVEAATWVKTIVETNLESGAWNVSNGVHITVNGDHPDMAKKAGHSYKPSSDFSGNWGDPAPMLDQEGKGYKGNAADQARSKSWGNVGGNDTYPTLSNPYIPKSFGDFKMKGATSVSDENGDTLAQNQSNDTWPNLQNPYLPKEAGKVGGGGYKAKADNLVVDK